MEFAKGLDYKNQKIRKQFLSEDSKTLHIITKNNSTGKYILYKNGKQITTSNEELKMVEKLQIEEDK